MVKKYRRANKKRAYRKKRRSSRSTMVIQRMFPAGKRTTPDQLKCTLFYTHEFFGGATLCQNGKLNYYNVNGNSLTNIMTYTGAGPTFIKFDAVSGAGIGFAGTVNTSWAGIAPAFLSQILGMYSNYYVSSSEIDVDVNLGSSGDEGDLYISPISATQSNEATAQFLLESRRCRTKKIGIYSYGTGPGNNLSHKISTREIMGQTVSDAVLTQNNSYVGSLGASPALPWVWQVGYTPRDNNTLAASLTFRTRMKYNVTFSNPIHFLA